MYEISLQQSDGTWKIGQGGHLWSPTRLKTSLQFQNTRNLRVQCEWEGDWAKFEPAWVILDHSTAVARHDKTQKCWRGSCLTLQQTENKWFISENLIVSCTTHVVERFSRVWDCLEDPGPFYCCGKTCPNADFLEKLGVGVGLGLGYKVDGHMPRVALSGSLLMQVNEAVF